jgi:hypothetical protein
MKTGTLKHGYRMKYLSTTLGALAGFMLLHPYAMLVYVLHERQGVVIHDLLKAAVFAFEPDMLVMGIPFAALGAAAGFFFGLWTENKDRRTACEIQLARWTRGGGPGRAAHNA